MEKLNVAIADDNEKMVEILGRMIEEDKDLTLVGKAHNGEEICNIIKERDPDVVVLDIIMPKMDGLTVMENCQHDHMLKKSRISGWTGTDHRGRFQPWRRILYAEAF